MTRLVPMQPAACSAYLQATATSYADENVASGRWLRAGALERSRTELDGLLPQGLATPDNHLFNIHDDIHDATEEAAHGPVIGHLWFGIDTRHGVRTAFVYDLVIHAPWRRRGHARRAFEALEPLVRALGLAEISLHVFGHNRGAQALYAGLGYGVTGLNMAKRLTPVNDNAALSELPEEPA